MRPTFPIMPKIEDVHTHCARLCGRNSRTETTRTRSERGDERPGYHIYCQQRTFGLVAYTTAVLEQLGYDVEPSDVECCRMAGSFGYKREYYELSMTVDERLQD